MPLTDDIIEKNINIFWDKIGNLFIMRSKNISNIYDSRNIMLNDDVKTWIET